MWQLSIKNLSAYAFWLNISTSRNLSYKFTCTFAKRHMYKINRMVLLKLAKDWKNINVSVDNWLQELW